MVIGDVENGRGLVVIGVTVGEAVCITLFYEDVSSPAVGSHHYGSVDGEYTMFAWCMWAWFIVGTAYVGRM